jgi:photosystem II stability/assembly factor-like uncharacterized protein
MNIVGVSGYGKNIIKSSNGKIYYSKDSGYSFKLPNTVISDSNFLQVAVSDNNSAVVCSSTNVYITQNNGVTWTAWNNIPNTSSFFKSVCISSNGQYCFVAVSNNGIYKSDNYGSTFTKINNTNNIEWTSISCYNQYILACSKYNGGIYISSDYGDTWNLNTTAPLSNWVSICIKNGFAIACTSSDIYVSTNNGSLWSKKNSNINLIKKAIISNYGYGIVLTTTNILITMNYGDTWNTFPSPSPINSTINDITVSNNGFLVVCDTNTTAKLYTTSIYSIYNSVKTFTSNNVSFITQGLVNNQVTFPLITNNQINITINPSSTPPDYYTLLFFNDIYPLTDFLYITINPNNGIYNSTYNYSFTDLQENTLYDISFQAVYSNLKALITKKIYTKSRPIAFDCNPSLATDVSLNISFTPCNNIPIAYNIRIQGINDNRIIPLYTTIFNSVTPITYTISGLIKDTEYNIQLDASYVDFSYNATNTYTFITKCAPIFNKIETNDYQSVNLFFMEPNFKDLLNNLRLNDFTVFLDLYGINNEITYAVQQKDITLNSDNTLNHTVYINGLITNSSYQVRLQSNYTNMQKIQSIPYKFNATPIPTVNIYYEIDPVYNYYNIITNVNLALVPTYYLITVYYPDQNDMSYNETTDYKADENIIYKYTGINYNPEGDLIYNNTYSIEVTAVYTQNPPTQYVTNIKSLIIAKTTEITYNNVVADISNITMPFFINITDANTSQYYLNLVNTDITNLLYVYNIPMEQSNFTSTYTFYDLYINSGTYQYFVTNNTDPSFKTDIYYIQLPQVDTLRINEITQTKNKNLGNLIHISYTVLYPNTYEPYYTVYIVNTTTNNTYTSTNSSAFDNSFNVNVNISGTYNIYITNYYIGGNYSTPVYPTTINIVPDVSFGTLYISNSYITIPYSIQSYITDPSYTISISGCISAFNASVKITPTENSSYAYTNYPIYYSVSTKFDVFANTGIYYYQITDGINIFSPTNNAITIPTTNATVFNITDTSLNNTFIVNYNTVPTYLPTYTLTLTYASNSNIRYSSTNTSVTDNSFNIVVNRSGNYNYSIKNNYKNVVNNVVRDASYTTPIKNIDISIPNEVYFDKVELFDISASNFFDIDISYSTINIPFRIPSYSTNILYYALYLKHTSINALDYSYNFYIEPSSEINAANTYDSSYTFTGIYVNSGNYRYYIVDKTTDVSYNPTTINSIITLPSISPTFSFSNIVSSVSSSSASLKANITILYPCYNSLYTFTAVSITKTDLSFSSVYDASSIIHDNKISYNNTNTIFINNITRSDTYNVYVTNVYNINSIERLSNSTSITIPNIVEYGTLIIGTNSVTIPFTITTYNIYTTYTIKIIFYYTDNSVYSNTYTVERVESSSDLTKGTTINDSHTFTNLPAKGMYYYYIYFQKNENIKYPNPAGTFIF